jgi:hypothetical protein
LRLLRLKKGTGRDIECELVQTTIRSKDLLCEAVSYTWGLDFKADAIRIHGKKLPVTFNLSLTPGDLRNPETDRILWIDAICINQQDESEKGHQVQRMKEIVGTTAPQLCSGRRRATQLPCDPAMSHDFRWRQPKHHRR